MNTLKVIGTLLLVVIVFGALLFAIQGTDFFMYKFFNPKYEQVRYNTFKQSQASKDAVAQEVQSQYLVYMDEKTRETRKQIIAEMILHDTAGFDLSGLSWTLQNWVTSLQTQGQ